MKEVIKDLDDIVNRVEHIKQCLSEYNNINIKGCSEELDDLNNVEKELENLLEAAGINFTKIKIVQKDDE